MSPRADLHLNAAARNLTIATEMRDRFNAGVEPTHRDWVITIVFYSALHLIDAYAVEIMETKPRNHQQRNQLVRTDHVLASIAGQYLSLSTASRTARYQPLASFQADDVQQAFDQLTDVRQLVTSRLAGR